MRKILHKFKILQFLELTHKSSWGILMRFWENCKKIFNDSSHKISWNIFQNFFKIFLRLYYIFKKFTIFKIVHLKFSEHFYKCDVPRENVNCIFLQNGVNRYYSFMLQFMKNRKNIFWPWRMTSNLSKVRVLGTMSCHISNLGNLLIS